MPFWHAKSKSCLALAEKELQIKQRNESLRKKEVDLETFSKVISGKEALIKGREAQMAEYEKHLDQRANILYEKEKTYGVQIQNGELLQMIKTLISVRFR